MPVPALDTTIGGANANSYATLAEANDYFDARLDAASWTGRSDEDKTRGLLMAARRLNEINWLGNRVTTTQALAWPRIGVAKRDGASAYSYGWGWGSYPVYSDQYRTDEIPRVVKEAQYEMALALLDGFNDGQDDEVESFSDDKMSVTFRNSKPAGVLPAEVTRLIAGLIVQNRLMRG